MNRLLFILSTCPNLTVLRLCYFFYWGRDRTVDLDGKAPAFVELSAFQELELNAIQYPLVQELIKRLRIPEECIVSLTPTLSGGFSNPSTYFLTPTFLQHRGRSQTAEVTLAYVPHTFHLLANSQRWRIVLELGNKVDVIRDTLRWFGISTEDGMTPSSCSDTSPAGSTTFNSGAITLKLRKAHNTFTVNTGELAPVSDFQCISRMKISRFSALELASLFQYLSGLEDPDQPSNAVYMYNYDSAGSEQPGSKKQTTWVWPFPCVSELVLEGMDARAMRALLGAIKSRSGDGATAGTPGMPARLKRIEFVDDEDPSWRENNNQGVDAHEAEGLLLEILDALDDTAELIWKGKRIFKA